jgi:metal transporter CNNM
MYTLSPVGYPVARLLDYLLGTYHDRTFSREGLKTLVMLHEVPRSPLNSPNRLHHLEASSICSLLSISTVPISEIMTVVRNAFTLPSDTYLNEIVRFEILKSGFNMIPIYDAKDNESFVGLLNVKSLIGLDFNGKDVMVAELELQGLRTVAPGTKLTEVLGIFRDRAADMVLITEGGKSDGKVLGIVTFRDLMESALGREMAMS